MPSLIHERDPMHLPSPLACEMNGSKDPYSTVSLRPFIHDTAVAIPLIHQAPSARGQQPYTCLFPCVSPHSAIGSLVIFHPILRPSYPPPHSTSSVCERMTAVSLHFMRVISYPIDRSSYPPSSYPPSLTSHQPSSPPPPMRTWETKTAIVAAAVVHRWLHADGPPVDKQIHRSRSDAGWSRPWCSHAALRRRHLAW